MTQCDEMTSYTLYKSDNIKQMITLTVITLSGNHSSWLKANSQSQVRNKTCKAKKNPEKCSMLLLLT
jgi:hypothetical protein